VLEPVSAGRASSGNEITARLRSVSSPVDLPDGETSRPDEPIPRLSTAVTAFVGRTLKGPVGEPTRIDSFAQYQQVFGGLWQPSTLSYSIEQFFENGGEEAVVVRVASGGGAPTLDLQCGADVLVLMGRCPGSREYLRASVDYDALPADDTDLFNLVLQRVRSPGSELVEVQEIHRRLSTDPDSPRFVSLVLDDSRLARVQGPVPSTRPDITPPRDPRSLVGYVACNADGDDGAPLNDYDIIGNEQRRSGLFALQGAGHFSLLCIPPLERERDVGMSVLLIAGRLCRQRHAMLIVDPPRDWTTPGKAIDGMRRWPFHTSDALMFYPRVLAQDRLRGRTEAFACSGAVAGMLARRDSLMPVWQEEEGDAVPLRPTLRPAVQLQETERQLLANYGVNTFGPSRGAAFQRFAARSLGATLGAAIEPRLLAGRRLALLVTASIERGTRWVLYGTSDALRRQLVAGQVVSLLEGLSGEGAFAPPPANSFVICDARINGVGAGRPGEFRLLYGYKPIRDGEFQAWLTTHRAGGSVTRAVTVNRMITVGDRVDVEVQTAILRGLSL
jgi:uncharacterized protein